MIMKPLEVLTIGAAKLNTLPWHFCPMRREDWCRTQLGAFRPAAQDIA
jgi:hypothetical protein